MLVSDLPDFEVDREIARGGLTSLYVCTHPEMGEVVVRMIKPNHEKDSRIVKPFKRGIQILDRLFHPNIIRMLDHGRIKRSPYMVVEYHDCLNLRECIHRTEYNLQENALATARQLANGLTFIHMSGFLHMDLKPENILIRKDKQVILIDFDFAMEHKSHKPVKVASILGTPNYRSPELLRFKKMDERAEIFTFGSILYELLTRHKPFNAVSANDYKIAIADPNRPHTNIREYRTDVSHRLELIVNKCLQKDPDKRYPSMALVKRDLDTLA